MWIHLLSLNERECQSVHHLGVGAQWKCCSLSPGVEEMPVDGGLPEGCQSPHEKVAQNLWRYFQCRSPED